MKRALDYINRKLGSQSLKNTLLELYESTIEGIVIVDAGTGKIESANPAFTESLGYSEKEVIGKTIPEMTAPEDAARTMNTLQQLGKKPTLLFENRLKTKDGKDRPVKWRTIAKHGKYICRTEFF